MEKLKEIQDIISRRFGLVLVEFLSHLKLVLDSFVDGLTISYYRLAAILQGRYAKLYHEGHYAWLAIEAVIIVCFFVCWFALYRSLGIILNKIARRFQPEVKQE